MQATHAAELGIPRLPRDARKAHIFPQLASSSLLSIGQLCDHGCSAYFDKSKLYILYNGRIIMQCTRNHTRLWIIDAPQDTTHSLNLIVDAPTIAERIKFYNASLFSPTLSTLHRKVGLNDNDLYHEKNYLSSRFL